MRNDEKDGLRVARVRHVLQTVRNKHHFILFKHVFLVVHHRAVTPALYVLKFEIAMEVHGHIIVQLATFQFDMRKQIRL